MKKPDAVTVISKSTFKDKVWPIPVSELLYVGRATSKRLTLLGCHTIGDLANIDPRLVYQKLGKKFYTEHEQEILIHKAAKKVFDSYSEKFPSICSKRGDISCFSRMYAVRNMMNSQMRTNDISVASVVQI